MIPPSALTLGGVLHTDGVFGIDTVQEEENEGEILAFPVLNGLHYDYRGVA
jgi:hypothetical protein